MSEAAAPRRRSLFRKPDFARLWTAATVSLFGTQVTPDRDPVHRGGGPRSVARRGRPARHRRLPAVPAVHAAGRRLGRPLLAEADPRHRRHRPGDHARRRSRSPTRWGSLTIGQLYLVGFVNGVFTVFFDVADQSYLPTVLERDELVDGNAKLQISQSAAMILGQPFGGGVIALFTAPIAIAVDALSFVASALLIFTIRRPEASQDATAGAAAVEATRGRGTGRWRRDRRGGSGGRGGARREARHANRDHERAPLHRREQVPAEHRSDDRDLEPVQQHRVRDVRGLRLPRAGPVAAVRRPDRRDRRSRRVDRRPHREPRRRAVRRRPGDRLAEP